MNFRHLFYYVCFMKQLLFLLFALPLVLVSCNPELSGCLDPGADNFNPEATVEDGSCVYGLAGCGGASTVTFDGYTYDLVAIGDQCWFAENLRTEHYANGDAIPGQLTDSQWDSTTSGAVTVYGEGTSVVSGGSYDEESNLIDYGRLYNWYAVDDARGLCPSGWHVPTDGEYTELTGFLGGSSIAGTQMKSSPSDNPSWDGTNTSGFSALAGGYLNYLGYFANEGDYGCFWSSSPDGAAAWGRILVSGNPAVLRVGNQSLRFGYSVRCVRD